MKRRYLINSLVIVGVRLPQNFLLFLEKICTRKAKRVREGLKNGNFSFGNCHEGGSCLPLTFFQTMFFKNHLESFPDCQNVFCTQIGLYVKYI